MAVQEVGLPMAEPRDHGLDGAVLGSLAAQVRAGTYPGTHSILVVRHGHLVFEQYFGRWHAGRLHEMQSISKSVVSASVGIALGRGDLESLDRPVVEFFPDLEIEDLSEWKRAITIADVLRMSTGVDYTEGYRGSPHSRLNRLQTGWTEFWLNRPMAAAPRTRWNYDSGGVIALSAVFLRATGMHVDDYSARFIFEPLGITEFFWERNAEGHPHAGGGLHLRSRDLAKFGLLVLQDGAWMGKQIIPADWLERSTAMRFRFQADDHAIDGYAYLWWILQPDPSVTDGAPIVAATGLGGQYLFIIPDHDMVVVVTGWSDDQEESAAAFQYLYDSILRSVLR